ncbi:hypothetical protein BJ742DRAFT_375827 [Cladochytrium replicatum]|nr:hypothetical protein BJ742DRAFT_375827 [Cladochytrium replicatum]
MQTTVNLCGSEKNPSQRLLPTVWITVAVTFPRSFAAETFSKNFWPSPSNPLTDSARFRLSQLSATIIVDGREIATLQSIPRTLSKIRDKIQKGMLEHIFIVGIEKNIADGFHVGVSQFLHDTCTPANFDLHEPGADVLRSFKVRTCNIRMFLFGQLIRFLVAGKVKVRVCFRTFSSSIVTTSAPSRPCTHFAKNKGRISAQRADFQHSPGPRTLHQDLQQ